VRHRPFGAPCQYETDSLASASRKGKEAKNLSTVFCVTCATLAEHPGTHGMMFM
jgi:hypothetical protein